MDYEEPHQSGEYPVAEGPREYEPDTWQTAVPSRERSQLTRGQAIGIGLAVVVTGLLVARWFQPARAM